MASKASSSSNIGTLWGMHPSLAETSIALIPKVDYLGTFKEFMPISLCNIVYNKIITKVLVNRLRPMLDSLISPF